MGSPTRAPMAATGLSWDERLDLRKTALNNAIAFTKGTARTYSAPDVIELATTFEKYLKGEYYG